MAPKAGSTAPESGAAAILLCYTILNQRSDFTRASGGLRHGTPGFHLQARATEGDAVRVGFTCSKKVGNAVARNRAKRRLREVARLVLPAHGKPGWDYVMVGRADVTARHDFEAMQADLVRALVQIHKS